MFVMSTPFINMKDIVAKMSFVCKKKKVKKDDMHGFLLASAVFILQRLLALQGLEHTY